MNFPKTFVLAVLSGCVLSIHIQMRRLTTQRTVKHVPNIDEEVGAALDMPSWINVRESPEFTSRQR